MFEFEKYIVTEYQKALKTKAQIIREVRNIFNIKVSDTWFRAILEANRVPMRDARETHKVHRLSRVPSFYQIAMGVKDNEQDT